MKEVEVDAEPCVVNTQSALPAKKRKVIPQLQEEVGQMADERILQIGFEVFVFEVKKFEDEGSLIASSRVTVSPGAATPAFLNSVALFRERDALIKLALDLPVELADRPS